MPDTTIIARLRAAGCVYAEDEAHLLTTAAHTPHELDTMVEQRVTGLPLEHILGWVDFHGLRLTVTPGVFVPRRRTEHLVHHATTLAPPHPVILDLCCGCGAIGAAIATTIPDTELHACDIDPAAIACARHNTTHITSATVHQGDLYQPLPDTLRGRIDIIAANVPYVPTDAIALMPPEARLHEPRTALDGGTDGLDILRRTATQAPHWLAPGGHLLIETSEQQAPHAAAIFTANGLTPTISSSDDLGATVVIGTLHK